MYFRFGTRKIVEAVGVLLQSAPGRRMGRLRLLKLLYIAERESLREIGRPIIGTKLVAMPQGPLHGEVYDLIKGSSVEEVWDQFIKSVHLNVELVADPGILHLSEYEMEKLARTATKYRRVTDEDLAAITHGFEEWVKNHKKGSSKAIPLKDVLEAVGREDDEESILADARHVATSNRLFGMPS